MTSRHNLCHNDHHPLTFWTRIGILCIGDASPAGDRNIYSCKGQILFFLDIELFFSQNPHLYIQKQLDCIYKWIYTIYMNKDQVILFRATKDQVEKLDYIVDNHPYLKHRTRSEFFIYTILNIMEKLEHDKKH